MKVPCNSHPLLLLAYINQELTTIKRNCLDRTPVTSDCLSLAAAEGLGWRTAGSLFLGTPQLCWGKFHCLSLSAERPPQHMILIEQNFKYIKCLNPVKVSEVSSVMSYSVTPWIVHGVLQARILEWVVVPFSRGSSQTRESLPAEPPGKPKKTGVGSLSILQGIFPTQELNWGLLHCRQIL